MLIDATLRDPPESLGRALYKLLDGTRLEASEMLIGEFDEALAALVDLRLVNLKKNWRSEDNDAIRECVSVLKLNALVVITPTPTVL